MVEIDADLAKNYSKLREDRGLTWEQLAADMQPQDRRVAAWMREQAAGDRTGSGARATAPRGRRARLPMDEA